MKSTNTSDEVQFRFLQTPFEPVTFACAHLGSLETLNLKAEPSL